MTDVTIFHNALCNTAKEFLAVEAVNGCAVVLCTESGVFIYVPAFNKPFPVQCGSKSITQCLLNYKKMHLVFS